MQRKVLGMLLVGLATILLVGIGADFASYTATRSAYIAVVTDDQELIALEPIQPYAYITGDGMLKIDISSDNPNWKNGEGTGISPQSEYDIDKVFNVTNKLWEGDSTEQILVTVESGNPQIELYSSKNLTIKNSKSAETTVSFTLYKGETGDVGLHLIGPATNKTTSLGASIFVSAVASP